MVPAAGYTLLSEHQAPQEVSLSLGGEFFTSTKFQDPV